MPKTKVEVYDKDQLIYPFIESDHVTFSNGMKITEMLDQSISMPKVTHEDSSFKVGVGDQDVSSAIVDSSVADMTIKGQTYQNILPEPTLRNKMIGKSMQRLNEGYDNIEVVDGVSKSAILKGNTLVNLFSTYDYQYGGYWGIIKFKNELMTTSKKYIAIIQYLPNGFQWAITTENGTTQLDYSENLYSIFTPTVNGSESNFFLHINDNGVTTIDLSELEKVKPMIIEYQEGMENWDIPYFEGMTSCKMPVLKTIGSNLISPFFSSSWDGEISNYEKLPNGYVLDNTINRISYCHNLDNLIVGKKYTFSCDVEFLQESSNNRVQVYFNGSGGDMYGLALFTNGTLTWTFTYNKKYNSFGLYFQTDGDVEHLRANITNARINSGETALTYEPYKSNILTCNEDLELRGIGDVKDTLDCLTGEKISKLEQLTVTNNTNWATQTSSHSDCYSFYYNTQIAKSNGLLICDNLPSVTSLTNGEGCRITGTGRININILKSKLNDSSINSLNDYLAINPLTFIYELPNASIKTVDLSSHGNWEKVVLDGDENWRHESSFAHNNLIEFKLTIGNGNIASVISDRFVTGGNDVERIACTAYGVYIRILKSKVNTVDEFKQWLSQNPTTVWYQTTTTQDNSIREMLSFANGHLQVSSEAENSLLPSVQYEIPTKNSYHMDLMKTNTLYTMKAKTVSGTFTIDGTSYNVNANGTFTSPSSMTDKLLVMSNKTNEEVMLLEGNVIDKTIPYFKGIKSAFEGEDKIEVLSTGKNLFDMNRRYDNVTNAQATVIQNIDEITVSSAESGTYVNANFVLDKNFFKGKTVTGSCLYESDMKGIGTVQINYRDTSGKNYYQSIKTSKTFTFPDEFVGEVLLCVYANNTNTPQSNTVTVKNIQLELGTKSTTYDSYKSNITKIPLLSPLRSLPNGVCDELIINRMKKKATLIQRIKTVTLDGSSDERWAGYNDDSARVTQGFYHNVSDLVIARANVNLYCDTLQPNINAIHSRYGRGVGTHNDGSNNRNIRLCLLKNELIPYGFSEPLKTNENVLRKWLQDNPTTVCYELATPVVTEVDLEGFPYIYKDGHIFLNSDIAPTTQITYSINQAQQIESANENLQRHEKEISRLQKLIAQYIQVEYESTLLSLKI